MPPELMDLVDSSLPLTTPKHELFCQQYIVKGEETFQAYINAGYLPKNRNVAKSDSLKLLKRSHIRARCAYLQRLIDSDRRWSKADKLKKLESILEDDSVESRVWIDAIRVHNRMVGDEMPINVKQEIAITHSISKSSMEFSKRLTYARNLMLKGQQPIDVAVDILENEPVNPPKALPPKQ